MNAAFAGRAADSPIELQPARPDDIQASNDIQAFVRRQLDGSWALDLMVEGAHCGACISRIERTLRRHKGVQAARLNLSTRRLHVAWQGAREDGAALHAAVEKLGYPAVAFDPERLEADNAGGQQDLLRCVAVAGFAAANVMILSISVWAGHSLDMGPGTRGLLHWLSALIALPAVAYAGRPFFSSAWRALRAGTTNMDVPISVGVVLACAMSLSETIRHGPYAYFDSAVTLLFFLLIGRYLDSRARGHARAAIERLMLLRATRVTVLEPHGGQTVVPADQVRPGAMILVAPGERVGVDGRIVSGASSLDNSLVSGESLPAAVGPGDRVYAGTLNLDSALRIETLAVGEATLLSEIGRLMELAEQRRGRYVALADRVSRYYAPVVHLLALLTFLAWTFQVGVIWQVGLLHAVAVLIITCPCALGLAVPAVQVIASGRLLRQGVLLKSPTALERLAAVDTVVFDKTGTLTVGRPELIDRFQVPEAALELAAAMAMSSKHVLARGLVAACPDVTPLDGVREIPGRGLVLATPEGEVRLGQRAWVLEGLGPDGLAEDSATPDGPALPEIWLVRPGHPPQVFRFEDRLREDAHSTVQALKGQGFRVELLSGDRAEVTAKVAGQLGIEHWRAGVDPTAKTAHLQAL
ncbi:MAG TPA: heavy metal translocating P-type ATPase, partial [Geminicoccus sp.]|uniref:heavy metal translocating P-type ATPase n=1 Tax=Geminicoccus sp. TaxID=2024832 RepID=UPI002C42EA3B